MEKERATSKEEVEESERMERGREGSQVGKGNRQGVREREREYSESRCEVGVKKERKQEGED